MIKTTLFFAVLLGFFSAGDNEDEWIIKPKGLYPTPTIGYFVLNWIVSTAIFAAIGLFIVCVLAFAGIAISGATMR